MLDVLVVGAGTGGCLAARRAAELGLKVLIIEQKQLACIGDKVCGDAIGRHHFEDLGLNPPRGEELVNEIKGIEVYSPDRSTVFRVESESLHGYMVNRRAFGARLLREALDAGAELLDASTALDLLIKGGYAKGVKVRDKYGELKEVEAKVVVDATGYPATLRRRVPADWLMEPSLLEDYVVCHREIRKLNEPLEKPSYCKIYLNQEASPGGYIWVFPRGLHEVNTGLGVQAGRGLNPRRLFYEHVIGNLLPSNSTIMHAGGGVVPTRRPLTSLVGDGFLVVGDAAYQANPIHGGGIGPSMRAGALAAEAIAEALDADDVSRRGLWSYPLKYNTVYGHKQASLDAFRIFLQTLNNDELNWGMKIRLITERDLLMASMGGELKVRFTDKALRLLRGIGKLRLLTKLRITARAMKRLRYLYLNYPSPEDIEKWKAEVEKVFVELKRGLAP